VIRVTSVALIIINIDMAVNINTVYNRVLAISNKENRGYITPQEFNLLANQAQLEIFEQYFYDLNQFNRMGEINNEHANIIKNIKEKINLFRKSTDLTYSNPSFALPTDLYRLGTVFYNNATEIEEIAQNEYLYINASPLTKPTTARPVFIREGGYINVYPTAITSLVKSSYIKIPAEVGWGYTDVDNVSLYDSSTTTDFELHESEETVLVYKILAYAGIVIRQPEISQIADQKDALKVQKEKS
jgi:hypothetical protein